MLVDTHCHLDLEHFDADRAAVVARAREAGVDRILVPGIDLAACRRAVILADQYAEVYAAVGIHPNEGEGFSTETLAALRDLARHPRVVAVGEIGIDLYWKRVPVEVQERVFREQLALAEELGLPVIIHDRDAHAEVMGVLREQAPRAGVVLHAFSGDAAMAEEALAAGFYLGVDGPLTYKKNDGLRSIFARAPEARILVETDAPYLTPEPRRGQRNEPAYVRLVADKLAEVRGAAPVSLAPALAANAARLFRWE
jgi:TatD DNase family protein